MNQDLINRISNYLIDNDENYSQNTATESEIISAENTLKLTFDDDYKQFIQLFGGCYVGESIYAFKNSNDLENTTVVELTQQLRNQLAGTPNDYYAISFDGAGNPIAMNQEGQVMLLDYNTGEQNVLASSFEKLIENNLPD
ncbi:MAG: SMI1/KNR4 family protein [Sphingobacteriaceae bacterium]|nr:MAG: SMI1/KNR4 family protein [Sphingobacteriaceae bacterium]